MRLLFSLLMSGLLVAAAGCRLEPGPAREVRFTRTVLTDAFLSEGVAIGDINRDGRRDVVAGTVWFESPQWTRHDIAETETFDPDSGYSDTFASFTIDADGDGWTDIIQFRFPGTAVYCYLNPGEENVDWRRDTVFETYGNESPIQADINGDGIYDLLMGDHATGRLVYLEAPVAHGGTNWKRNVISRDSVTTANRFAHGLGFGDVNGDARPDVLSTSGWWEAPADMDNGPWRFHAADWGPEAAQMYAIDADADGDHDILSTSVHDYGVWMHINKDNPGREDSWELAVIDESISQTHALATQDVDRDGDEDLITGKRYKAHNGNDPGTDEPAMLVWYESTPSASPADSWIRHVIDEDSGVGTQVVTGDLNGDTRPDIVAANKKGVFVFVQE